MSSRPEPIRRPDLFVYRPMRGQDCFCRLMRGQVSPVADVVHEEPGLNVEARPRSLLDSSGGVLGVDPPGGLRGRVMGVGWEYVHDQAERSVHLPGKVALFTRT